MTKTPKNGSASSTPTPGGGPGGPASTGAPPSVGSTKSEPTENDVTSHDSIANRSGTPHSLPENTSCSGKETNEENTAVNGGSASSSAANNATSDGLLCDNNPEGSSGPVGSAGESTNANNDGNSDNNDNNAAGAQVKHEVKHEDVKPNLSNCSTPIHQQGPNASLPSDTDFLDGFDSKDGGNLTSDCQGLNGFKHGAFFSVKDEADDSDIPPLAEFKDEDLIDFPNGKYFWTLFSDLRRLRCCFDRNKRHTTTSVSHFRFKLLPYVKWLWLTPTWQHGDHDHV